MRRKILIVGAGQSGLQLALGLQQHDYDVTVMSARTPSEIRIGKVMSTQVMFGPALARERALGLGFWDDQAPPIDSIQVTVAGQDGDRMLNWIGYLDEHAQSVDQRLKMSAWLEEFGNLGGNVVIHGSTLSDLGRLAEMCDLTIVAAGRGELADLFQRNPQHSPYTTPQRKLAVSYVHGLDPLPDYRGWRPVNINLIPGAGELFIMPALTTTGRGPAPLAG